MGKLPIYPERLHAENLSTDGGQRGVHYEDTGNHTDGLVTDLVLDDKQTFKRVFIGPHTSDQQFANSIPFVALDGTFLLSCWKLTLLLAIGRSGNNESWLIA